MYLRNLTYPRMMLGTPTNSTGSMIAGNQAVAASCWRPWPCTRPTNGRPSNNSSPGSRGSTEARCPAVIGGERR